MRRRVRVNVTLPYLLLLAVILIGYKPFSSVNSFAAISAPIDHQEIINTSSDWKFVKTNANYTEIYDGRKVYFIPATDRSQCNISSLKIPKINSVSYFSDGNTLNTTFWLSHTPLEIGTQFVNASKIRQDSLDIDIVDLRKDRNLSEETDREINSIKKEYNNNWNFTQPPTLYSLDNNQAINFTFTARAGGFNVTETSKTLGSSNLTITKLLTVKNEKLYKLTYVTESKEFSKSLPTVKSIFKSFSISDKKVTTGNTTSITSKIRSGIDNKLVTYVNHKEGIEIRYPSNWQMLENPGSITFFSPIDGPYLQLNQYTIAIDVPSTGHNLPIDFATRILWDDTHFNHKWAKTIEEISSSDKRWLIDAELDYKDAFKEGRNYVILPLDLSIINSPEQYFMTFATEARFIQDGRLCNLLDVTGQASSPPPEFYVLPSINSTTIGPGEVKNIEIEVRSLTNINSTVRLSIDTSSMPLKTTFNPDELNLVGLGWAATQLTIETDPSVIFKQSSSPYSLPIKATMTFPKYKPEVLIENSSRFVSAGFALKSTSETKFPITVLNFPDYILHVLNSLSSPINIFIGLASLIVGVIGGRFLKKSKDERGSEENGKPRKPTDDRQTSSSISALGKIPIGEQLIIITRLKERGILSESEFLVMVDDLLKKK
jgi:hypothetical protein